MRRILEWVLPRGALWTWRDQLFVFYEKQWIHVRFEDRQRYMQIYGVWR